MSMATMSMATATLGTDVFTCKKAKMDAEHELELRIDNMNSEQSLLVKKLSAYATVPTRGSSQAAGYDLYRY